MDQVIPLLGIYMREIKACAPMQTCMWLFTEAFFFIVAKGVNNPTVQTLEDALWSIHGKPLHNKRRTTADTRSNTDESQKHCAKWKKPLTKNYLLNYLFIWHSGKKQNNRDKNKWVIAWSGAQKGRLTRKEWKELFGLVKPGVTDVWLFICVRTFRTAHFKRMDLLNVTIS